MNTNLNIEVDMGRVQSSVQAAIRPAVEEALTAYDIKAAILKQLTTPRPDERSAGEYPRDHWSFPHLIHHASLGAGDIGTLLDDMVHEGIRQIAKEYVTSNLQMQRSEIEEAFRKMMNGSTNRLVKAFAGAVEDALKSDWGFDLEVKVQHKGAERSGDAD